MNLHGHDALIAIALLPVGAGQFFKLSRIEGEMPALAWGDVDEMLEPCLVFKWSFCGMACQCVVAPGELLEKVPVAGAGRVWIEFFETNSFIALASAFPLLATFLQNCAHRQLLTNLFFLLVALSRAPPSQYSAYDEQEHQENQCNKHDLPDENGERWQMRRGGRIG